MIMAIITMTTMTTLALPSNPADLCPANKHKDQTAGVKENMYQLPSHSRLDG